MSPATNYTGSDTTLATISSDVSSVTITYKGDTGTFTPTGTIAIGGGFCGNSTCPITFEGFDIQAAASFTLGSHTIDSLSLQADAPFAGTIAGSAISIPPANLPSFSASIDTGGNSYSNSASAATFSGTLDNTVRQILLSGQLLTSDGQVTFTNVVATLGDSPAVAVIDAPATGECGVPVVFSGARSFDPDGEPVAGYAWFELTGPGTETFLGTGETLSQAFAVGDHLVVLSVSDPGGRGSMIGTVVHISDTVPPRILSVSADPSCLWPPNHDLVHYALGQELQVQVEDACDANPSVAIVDATSSEPALMPGSGDTSPDVFLGNQALCLRSERSGTGDGRVYTIGVQATNVNGLVSQVATAIVTVPHDEGAATRCPALAPDLLLADGDPLCSFSDAGDAPTGGDAGPPAAVSAAGCSTGAGEALTSAVVMLAAGWVFGRRRRTGA